ncbi:MAG: Fic family protein [Kofleriaceae bacterium]
MTIQDPSTRAIEFLHESNAIEDITNVDYTLPQNAATDRGHFGAFLDSQRKAEARIPLSIDDLCQWQRWLTEEQTRFGHTLPAGGAGTLRSPQYPMNVRVGFHIAPSFEDVPQLLATWLSDLNIRVASISPYSEDFMAADALGEFFQRFEALHPFVDGNGRTGRLLANYLATAYGLPIIVFRLNERDAFYAAHRSKMAMRVFMADKIREAIFFPGQGLLLRKEIGSSADIYDGLTVERHQLIKKQREWRARADPASAPAPTR